MAFDDEIRMARAARDAETMRAQAAADSAHDRLRRAQHELAAIGREAVDECRRRRVPIAAAVRVKKSDTMLRGEVWDFSLQFTAWRLGSMLLREDGVFFRGTEMKVVEGQKGGRDVTYEKARARALRRFHAQYLFASDEGRAYVASGATYDPSPSDWFTDELVIDDAGTLFFQRSRTSFRSSVGRSFVESESL